MLVIRKEQMEILATANTVLFEQRLMAQFKRHFPQRAALLLALPEGETKVLEWMRKRFDQAAGYGIEFEGDYAIFVMLVLEIQRLRNEDLSNSDRFLDWTQGLLEREGSKGQVKIALIAHRLEKQAQTDQRAARLVFIINSMREEFG